MPKKMEFARGVDDSTDAEKKKPKIVYPAEARQKLDDSLGVARDDSKKKIELATEKFMFKFFSHF